MAANGQREEPGLDQGGLHTNVMAPGPFSGHSNFRGAAGLGPVSTLTKSERGYIPPGSTHADYDTWAKQSPQKLFVTILLESLLERGIMEKVAMWANTPSTDGRLTKITIPTDVFHRQPTGTPPSYITASRESQQFQLQTYSKGVKESYMVLHQSPEGAAMFRRQVESLYVAQIRTVYLEMIRVFMHQLKKSTTFYHPKRFGNVSGPQTIQSVILDAYQRMGTVNRGRQRTEQYISRVAELMERQLRRPATELMVPNNFTALITENADGTNDYSRAGPAYQDSWKASSTPIPRLGKFNILRTVGIVDDTDDPLTMPTVVGMYHLQTNPFRRRPQDWKVGGARFGIPVADAGGRIQEYTVETSLDFCGRFDDTPTGALVERHHTDLVNKCNEELGRRALSTQVPDPFVRLDPRGNRYIVTNFYGEMSEEQLDNTTVSDFVSVAYQKLSDRERGVLRNAASTVANISPVLTRLFGISAPLYLTRMANAVINGINSEPNAAIEGGDGENLAAVPDYRYQTREPDRLSRRKTSSGRRGGVLGGGVMALARGRAEADERATNNRNLPHNGLVRDFMQDSTTEADTVLRALRFALAVCPVQKSSLKAMLRAGLPPLFNFVYERPAIVYNTSTMLLFTRAKADSSAGYMIMGPMDRVDGSSFDQSMCHVRINYYSGCIVADARQYAGLPNAVVQSYVGGESSTLVHPDDVDRWYKKISVDPSVFDPERQRLGDIRVRLVSATDFREVPIVYDVSGAFNHNINKFFRLDADQISAAYDCDVYDARYEEILSKKNLKKIHNSGQIPFDAKTDFAAFGTVVQGDTVRVSESGALDRYHLGNGFMSGISDPGYISARTAANDRLASDSDWTMRRQIVPV